MLLIQITAAHGPAECELAAQLTLKALLADAQKQGIAADVLEQSLGEHGLKSALLSVSGPQVQPWLRQWQGSIQWVFASPLRVGCLRKNWFVAVQQCPVGAHEWGQSVQALRQDDVVFQACRASGKGGQHVNTTDSAVHAVHKPSGLAVKVMTARSQHANKQLALALLSFKLAQIGQRAQADAKAQLTQLHWQVDRGSPVRVFKAAKRKDGRLALVE